MVGNDGDAGPKPGGEPTRRTLLRTVGGVGVGGALAGCLSSSSDGGEHRGTYTGDPATQFEEGCHRGEIFEDQVRLSGTLSETVIGTASATWRLDIEDGEHLIISIAARNPREGSPNPPTVEFVDPEGTVLLDRTDGQSTYDVTLEATGEYELRVSSGELLDRHWWRVSAGWDPHEEC